MSAATTGAPTGPTSDPHGDAIALLQAQVAALTQRLAQLEAASLASDRTQPPDLGAVPASGIVSAQTDVTAAGPAITEEEVLAISAALAAYLGVRLRIRQIRLLSSSNWAQQGRVSIQASHRLNS